MKPAETEKLYKRACMARRMSPEQEEAQMWHRTLKQYDARDVQAALDAWDVDTHDEGQGPRGKWLPKPAELKSFVEAAQRKREAASREPQDLLIWSCTKCAYKCTGFIAHSAVNGGKKCRVCNAPMSCERKAA